MYQYNYNPNIEIYENWRNFSFPCLTIVYKSIFIFKFQERDGGQLGSSLSSGAPRHHLCNKKRPREAFVFL